MTWRLWPLLPTRSIPRYLEHMERDKGLRFMGLGWVPLFAKYKRIHPLHSANYDIDYFPEKDPAEIQEYFDMCEASGWEPVLQQGHYKVFREQLGGAIPLYWEEDERKAVWKKARNKHLIITLICLTLVILLLWLVYGSVLKTETFLWDVIFYYMPLHQQLFTVLIMASLLYAVWLLFLELLGVTFRWDNDLPGIFYGIGTITMLVSHIGIVLLTYSGAMAVLVEHRDIGTFFAVFLGNRIGTYMRNYRDQDADDRRKLKGFFGPPKSVATASAIAIVILLVGIMLYPLSLAYRPSEPKWIQTENLACETVVYNAQNPDNEQCLYELRDSIWIRRDLDRHRNTLMDVIAEKDIFHYMTPEGLKEGILDDRSLFNARRAHVVAAEMLMEDPEIDQVLISQIGHRYIVACGDQVYRLHCDLTFYDDPMLGMEETDVPKIEETGREIYENLIAQKEELEKMFLN